MNIELPFNWVDIAIIAFLAFGIFRGRKHGLSQELVPLIQWIVLVVGCGFAYKPLGEFIVSFPNLNLSVLFAYIASYLLVAVAIKGVFALIKSGAGGKLVGSDIFGAGEYYLGMAAGVIRYSCMVVFAMALINAKLVPEEQARAVVASQTELYGKDYFFRIEKVQKHVFGASFIGRFVKGNLGFLLIEPTMSVVKVLHQKEYQMP